LLNILLIDDSSDYRALLKRLITKDYPDIQVEEYDPDANGIPETSKNWKGYSIVLLDYDLGLENENGLDWLQILHTYPDMPPIVILTSETNTLITVRALKLGAANYILKSDVNSDNIISKLAESFELARIEEETLAPEVENVFDVTDRPESGYMLADGTLAPAVENVFDVTGEPDMENKVAEETLAPEIESIFDVTGVPGSVNMLDDETLAPEEIANILGDDDESFQSDGVCLLIPGYTIQREIAKGGMSTVLLAKRIEDNMDVVVKVLYTQGQEDPTALKRFMQEYNLISVMQHPNIIHIYERAFATDFAYIVLEYLPEGDLSNRIHGGIPAETAMSYLRQIALGLGAIHKLDIIHRDLKPGNILFHGEDTLKITDFGAAKIISDEMQDITINNMVVGTPYYMSPEQGTGMKVDKRSDIYSLGVLFYQMLTGKKLFKANSIAKLIRAHLRDPVPTLPEDMSKYQSLIEGMLAKDPDERFQTTDELIAGVDWIVQS